MPFRRSVVAMEASPYDQRRCNRVVFEEEIVARDRHIVSNLYNILYMYYLRYCGGTRRAGVMERVLQR